MIVENLQYFMVLTGAWKMEWTENPVLRTAQIWYRRFILGVFYLSTVVMFLKLIQLLSTKADNQMFFKCISTLITATGFAIKGVIYQKIDVSTVFQEIIEEEDAIMRSLDDKLIKLYEEKLKVYIKAKNLITYASVVTGFLIFYSELKAFIKANEEGQKSEIELRQEFIFLPLWLPFKQRDYLITSSIVQILSLFAIASIYLSNEFTFYGLMLFAGMKLGNLKFLIRKLEATEGKEFNSYEVLRCIAKSHFNAIMFVRKVNMYTNAIALTDCLLYSLSMATTVVTLLMESTVQEVVYPILHLIFIIFNIFSLGWFANEIKIQNISLGEELMALNWYNYDLKSQKLLLVILQKSQSPLGLYIGPFGLLTLETFINVMKAAYSYSTVMRNLK